MHPTVERLWMFKQLTGTMTDLTWPDTHTDVGATSNVEGANLREPRMISFYSDDCAGHRGSDVYPFGLMKGVGDSTVRTGLNTDGNVAPGEKQVNSGGRRGLTGGNTLTNREILAALDPRVNTLPYVYDTFRWPHCEAQGFHMDDAWHVLTGSRGEDEVVTEAEEEDDSVKQQTTHSEYTQR